MSTNYPHLFSPLRIGNVTLKNRIATAPMGSEPNTSRTLPHLKTVQKAVQPLSQEVRLWSTPTREVPMETSAIWTTRDLCHLICS